MQKRFTIPHPTLVIWIDQIIFASEPNGEERETFLSLLAKQILYVYGLLLEDNATLSAMKLL